MKQATNLDPFRSISNNNPPPQNFITPSFNMISSTEDKVHKASPASTERISPSLIVKPATGSISSNEFFSMGYIRRKTKSQDGDSFTLPAREMVVVTRVYDKRGLAELLWNGLVGLFPLDDVELVPFDQETRGGKAQNNQGQDYYMSYESRGDISKVDSLPRFGGPEESTILNGSMNNTSITSGGMPSKMAQRQLRKLQKNNILDRVLDN